MTSSRTIVSGMLLLAVGCVDPYVLPYSEGVNGLLVVDGLLSADGSVTVSLTRSIRLDDTHAFPPEQAAEVAIADASGTTWALNERAPGEYVATGLPVVVGDQYKLIANLKNGQQVTSQMVTLKRTPPISSLTWEAAADGITIFASTTDGSGESRFYKWDYTETWEYTSAFQSFLKYNFGSFEARRPEEFIFRCYRTVSSTSIMLSSTLRLEQDLTTRIPIMFIPKGSQKLTHRYSIKVTERALSREEYDYWSNLERTTEEVGGLFDALPSQVVGNITSTDRSTVLGLFSASMLASTRIFVNQSDLPPDLILPQNFSDCMAMNVNDVTWAPTSVVLISGSSFTGYTYSSAECVDCRFQGGITTKPDFWD